MWLLVCVCVVGLRVVVGIWLLWSPCVVGIDEALVHMVGKLQSVAQALEAVGHVVVLESVLFLYLGDSIDGVDVPVVVFEFRVYKSSGISFVDDDAHDVFQGFGFEV